MSDYTGVALHLKFKADLPAFIFYFIQKTFDESNFEEASRHVTTDRNLNDTRLAINHVLYGRSRVFMKYQGCTLTKQFGHYHAECRSSIEKFDSRPILLLLQFLAPYLLYEDGDILARFIHESSDVEDVIYFDNRFAGIGYGFCSAKGYDYSRWPRAYTHPKNLLSHIKDYIDDAVDPRNEITPPLNINAYRYIDVEEEFSIHVLFSGAVLSLVADHTGGQPSFTFVTRLNEKRNESVGSFKVSIENCSFGNESKLIESGNFIFIDYAYDFQKSVLVMLCFPEHMFANESQKRFSYNVQRVNQTNKHIVNVGLVG